MSHFAGFRSLALLLIALALPDAATADAVYRWVDAQGVVHYSSVAPRGVDFERIDPGARPRALPSLANPRAQDDAEDTQPSADTAAAPADATEPSADDLGLTEEQQLRRAALQAEASDRRAQLAQQRQERCQAARRQYDELTTHSRVRIRDDSGRERLLSEEELQDRIARARDAIVTNCD